ARVVFARGNLADAHTLIDETVANFRNSRHPRIATALALRAEVLKAAGDATPPFAGTDDLPDEVVQQLIDAVHERLQHGAEPRLIRRVLDDLLPLAVSRLGEDSPSVVGILATVANLERDLGDRQAREQAIRQVIALQDRLGNAAGALQALMGLALARSDAGDREGAVATYEEALERADRLGERALRSQLLRN